MFVDIENPKSPLKVANILTAYDRGVVVKGVRQSPQKLTPEVCFDILKSTNYPRCIRDILQLIAKLPDEEQAQFKDVVLACFDNREQPEPIFQLGQELAEKSGYGIEFAKLKKINEGPYWYSEANAQKCYMCLESEFINENFRTYDKVVFLSDKKIQFSDDVKFPKNMEFPNSSDVSLTGLLEEYNFTGVQSIRFKEGAKVSLHEAYNLPIDIDFSMCDEVDLRGCDLSEQPNLRFKDGAKVSLDEAYNLPANLDFSQCDTVNLSDCNLDNQPNLRFKDGAKVNLGGAYNLPANLDVSCCDEVDLRKCDLSGQPNLRFKKGAKVYLGEAENLPANLDFSQCDTVYFEKCDLKGQPNLRFKDGAKVSLYAAKNLPVNLDVSCCDEVNLGWCDLSSQPNLRFKYGASVYLWYVENLPANLDFSQCDEVNLGGCDLSEQPNLRFKDGAKVDLSAYNLPANLDVSLCSEVNLSDCDLGAVKKLVFKNREQMEESGAKLPDRWKGKLVFADEQQQTPSLGLVMGSKAKGGR